jgi:hypothetical protein
VKGKVWGFIVSDGPSGMAIMHSGPRTDIQLTLVEVNILIVIVVVVIVIGAALGLPPRLGIARCW